MVDLEETNRKKFVVDIVEHRRKHRGRLYSIGEYEVGGCIPQYSAEGWIS